MSGERTTIRTVAGNEVRIERKGTSSFVDLEVWDPRMDDGPLVAVRLNASDLPRIIATLMEINETYTHERAQRRAEMERQMSTHTYTPDEIRRKGLSDG